jgi:hypothetical protein
MPCNPVTLCRDLRTKGTISVQSRTLVGWRGMLDIKDCEAGKPAAVVSYHERAGAFTKYYPAPSIESLDDRLDAD